MMDEVDDTITVINSNNIGSLNGSNGPKNSELTLSQQLDGILDDFNGDDDNNVSETSALLEDGDRTWGEGLFGKRPRAIRPTFTERIENFCSSKTILKILAYCICRWLVHYYHKNKRLRCLYFPQDRFAEYWRE